ncbi:MAG: helix-turn-helix domain-containing protein [Pseudomonadota bacterium]|nr:helix-turn-helix domain-containing protein [Pseudomonadota bacterium]
MPNDLSSEIIVSGNHALGNGMLQSVVPSFDLKAFRVRKRESQEKFWSRFGVTQSSGSRFETGMLIPTPVAILVKLYVKGTLNDTDLLE